MKNRDKDDREKIESFFPEDAASVINEISAGDRLFKANPAPSPDPRLLESIKLRMAQVAADQNRLAFRRLVFGIISAAAVVAVIALASIKFYSFNIDQSSGSALSADFWNSGTLPQEPDLEAQINSLANPDSGLLTLETLSDSGNYSELESDISQLNEFWEG